MSFLTPDLAAGELGRSMEAPRERLMIRPPPPHGQYALRLGPATSADITVLFDDAGGGAVHPEVVSVLHGNHYYAHKHLGPLQYEDLTLHVGLSMSDGLFTWIATSWGANPSKQSGATLTLDYKLDILSAANFSGAVITETRIPPLDAASSDPGYLTVRLQSEAIDVAKGTGKLSLLKSVPRLWRTSNFRLSIDGLDCTRVSGIEAFTVRREVKLETSAAGGTTLVPGRIEFPNLRVTLTQASAPTWWQWFDDFVLQGHNDDGFERSGHLCFLAPDRKAELSRIDLHHLGIIWLAAKPGSFGRVVAELYCEEMRLGAGEN